MTPCKYAIRLHALEVVALLDLELALLAHGLAELLAGGDGRDSPRNRAFLVAGHVNALLLQRDLGRQRLQVALGHQACLDCALALSGDTALFLGFG